MLQERLVPMVAFASRLPEEVPTSIWATTRRLLHVRVQMVDQLKFLLLAEMSLSAVQLMHPVPKLVGKFPLRGKM